MRGQGGIHSYVQRLPPATILAPAMQHTFPTRERRLIHELQFASTTADDISAPSCARSMQGTAASCLYSAMNVRASTVWGSNPGVSEIFRPRPDRSCGPRSLLHNGYRVSFLGYSGRGVTLTTHSHLAPG